MSGQGLVRAALISLWILPLIILLSPFHDNLKDLKLYYLVLFYLLITPFILFQRKIKYTDKILSNDVLDEKIYLISKIINILILLPTLFVIVKILLSGNSIADNRDYYSNQFLIYNYTFVLSIFFVLFAIIYSEKKLWKIFSLVNYFLIIILMLLTGNRQFAFFSIIFLFIFKNLRKKKIQNFKKVILIACLLVIIFIIFGIYRLDYVSPEEQAGYLGRLFDSNCIADYDFCDSYFNLIYQYLYGYVGINILGFQLSLEYFNKVGSLPFLSTTFPVISRRLQSIFEAYDLDALNEKFENFVMVSTDINFPHFFSTMFGAIAREVGLIGLIAHAVIYVLITNYFIKIFNRSQTNFNYMIVVFFLSYPFFGFLQYPMSEPFFFNTFSLIFVLVFIKSIISKVK